jgi:hypothetical protein
MEFGQLVSWLVWWGMVWSVGQPYSLVANQLWAFCVLVSNHSEYTTEQYMFLFQKFIRNKSY